MAEKFTDYKADFDEVVSKSYKQIVIALFTGKLLGSTPIITTIAEGIKEDFGDQIALHEFSYDLTTKNLHEATSQFPKVLILKKGNVLYEYTGIISRSRLKAKIHQHL